MSKAVGPPHVTGLEHELGTGAVTEISGTSHQAATAFRGEAVAARLQAVFWDLLVFTVYINIYILIVIPAK